ncbi:protein kinase domain-containing protein [Planosporangium sp. 12N6]|uniref:protein kinase domain-containing protein n=1 Tax=Planosporangium spinosum TaxID=3402278 RepID=UPI003CF47B0A
MDAVEVLGGRYRLVERLGAGGMSVVWRAHDEVLNRQVAIKVLAATLAADADSRAMIRAEAQAAARLSHPHITGVYDYGESTTGDGETVPYVVMELISGRTLAERLAGGPMPWRAALRVGAEVAAALAAAHARGLVHRDVKPANIMLTASGVKVVDFGIAAVAGETGEPRPDGTVLGTPAYLAPERLDGGPVRPASDVYALGLLLYRALAGGMPWTAETTTQMINANVQVEPRPLPAITGLPDGVTELCLRCLAKNPSDRPTSAEVARALATAAGIRVPLPAGADDPEDLVLDPSMVANAPAGRLPERLRLAVAALFGAGIDPAAETAILPGAVLDSAAVRNARRLRRRRAIQVGGATASIAVAGLALATCAALPGDRRATLAIAADGAGANRAPCAVRYVTRADTGSRFDVELSITNNEAKPLDRWTLRFAFAGDQTLTGGSAGEWAQQSDGTVTVRGPAGDPSLAAGAQRTLDFSAGYRTANPMPTAFTLNGAECSYVLVGASGETRTGGPGRQPAGGGEVEAAGGQGGADGYRGGGRPAQVTRGGSTVGGSNPAGAGRATGGAPAGGGSAGHGPAGDGSPAGAPTTPPAGGSAPGTGAPTPQPTGSAPAPAPSPEPTSPVAGPTGTTSPNPGGASPSSGSSPAPADAGSGS